MPVSLQAQPWFGAPFGCSLFSVQKLTLKSCRFWEPPKGVIQRSLVEKFLSETKCFPKSHMTQFFKLLEKFQIALPFGEDQLLVPSRWPHSRPSYRLACFYSMSKKEQTCICFLFQFVQTQTGDRAASLRELGGDRASVRDALLPHGLLVSPNQSLAGVFFVPAFWRRCRKARAAQPDLLEERGVPELVSGCLLSGGGRVCGG